MKQIILHADLDAFFASVEERENPILKDRPVVVGADPKDGRGRGVVSTCNYKARKFGISSGMPISIAYRKCPEAVFLPVRMQLYVNTSKRVIKLFKRFSDKFEQASIDEAYLDISSKEKFWKAKRLARKIQLELFKKEKLTCSIGMGPNKLIAKIASDANKPNGITVVRPSEIQNFLDPLPIRKMPGIGPKTETCLNECGIFKIGDLRKLTKESLTARLGIHGNYLFYKCRGIDYLEVSSRWVQKSVGRRITFEKDTKDEELMFTTMKNLVESSFKRMKKKFKSYRTVTVTARYADFETRTKSKTFSEQHEDENTAQILARSLIWQCLKDSRKLRLIGVSLSNLK